MEDATNLKMAILIIFILEVTFSMILLIEIFIHKNPITPFIILYSLIFYIGLITTQLRIIQAIK